MKDKTIRLIISGAEGQLGRSFEDNFINDPLFEVIALNKQALDITSHSSVLHALKNIQPHYFINCAAYTAVDRAEAEEDLCYSINAEACRVISETLKPSKVKLIHFSSDYVYNTFNFFPLAEDDALNPSGVYAKSKLEGEKIIRNSNIPALIIRTSWVCSKYGHNFLKTILRLSSERKEIHVVNDQYGAPTFAPDLVTNIIKIIKQVEKDKTQSINFSDTYNFSNEGIITWFDFATQIIKEIKSECTVHPIQSIQYPTPARRPFWSVMSKNKIKNNFALQIPHWLSSMRQCLHDLKNQNTKEGV